MKNFKFKINGNNYDVTVEELNKGLAQVQVNGKTVEVEIEGQEAVPAPKTVIPKAAAPKKEAAAPASPTPKAAAGSNVVKAPIPGSIFKIIVTTGQAVKKGDTLLVMESMKMENSIQARKDGVVGNIYVQLGQTVLQGDAMLDLD